PSHRLERQLSSLQLSSARPKLWCKLESPCGIPPFNRSEADRRPVVEEEGSRSSSQEFNEYNFFPKKNQNLRLVLTLPRNQRKGLKEVREMTNRSKNFLSCWLLAIALTALLSIASICAAQVSDAPATAPAPNRANNSNAGRANETVPGTPDVTTTQSTPQAGSSQGGVSGLASRVKTFSRNGPVRESWNTFDLGTKYARAVIGGFEQGAS